MFKGELKFSKMKKNLLFFLVFCFFSKVSAQINRQDSLLNLLAKQNDQEALSAAIKLGNELLLASPDDAIKCASIALQKAVNLGLKPREAEARNLLANAYLQRSQAGDIKEAFKLYTQNLETLEKNNRPSQEEELEKARALSGLANIYYQWGEYKEATLLNIKSLRIREKLKDEFGMARCFNTSGVIYDALGEYKKAIVEYTKALNIYEKLKKKQETAGVLDNLASSLRLQIEISKEENPDYSQVIDYYNRSLKISEEINDTKGISRTLNNLGILAQSQKNYSKAQKYFERSLETALRAKEKQGLASTYNNLARLHQEQDLLDEALALYDKALEAADEAESKYELYVTLKERSKVYALKGLFTDAYSDLQASNTLKAQLDEAENLRTINSLMGRYEIEKFQKENEKLKYEATIQSQNNKIFWGFASFFFAIAILTAIFYFRQHQIQATHNKKLKALNEELERKNQEISILRLVEKKEENLPDKE
jgi:tetratricopeptide (TPR) repeat protein